VIRLFVLSLALAACAATGDDLDDGEATTAPAQPIGGKGDGAAVTGLFASRATTHYQNDVPNLELRADGRYVRSRCYHAACALPVAETDHYDVYTSSGGKTYIRFWSFELAPDASGALQSTPTIADVYELQKTSTGIKLRKAYSSRWQSLPATDAATACTRSGGAWGGTDCSCPGSGNGATVHPGFVAGAGGCIAIPGGGEDACDSSGGLYTDDDATLVGTFCECGLGRHVVDAGSCAAI
jgi:hypothetical protein